jgi:glycine cleavage system H protein
MNIPGNLLYTKDHEWLKVEGDIATVGITEHAQHQLGDIVFVELPEENEKVEEHGTLGVVESTKAVSDIYSPVAGTVIERNDPVIDSPERINEDPYADGWLVRIKFTAKSDDLMDAAAYEKYLKEEV